MLAVDFDAFEGPPVRDDDGAMDSAVVDVVDAPSDVATDAGSDATLESGSPCSAMHAFCADFDENPYNAGFSKINMTGTGVVGPDSLSLSPPTSLHATTTRKPADAPGNWLFDLEKDFNLSWRRVVFQGDLYFVKPDWQKGDINIGLVAVYMFSDTGNTGSVFFQSQTSATGSIENPTSNATVYATVPSFSYSTWTHIIIDFDPAGHLHYNVGGNTFDKDFAAITGGGSQSLQVQVGALSYNQPIPGMDIRWDNVFVDFPK